MASKKIHKRLMFAVLAGVLALITVGCRSGTPMEGVYRADGNAEGQARQLSIELKENGAGTWRADGDEVPFRWEVKGREVRLATKAGGIITGRIEGNVIHIELPGRQSLSFTKTD